MTVQDLLNIFEDFKNISPSFLDLHITVGNFHTDVTYPIERIKIETNPYENATEIVFVIDSTIDE